MTDDGGGGGGGGGRGGWPGSGGGPTRSEGRQPRKRTLVPTLKSCCCLFPLDIGVQLIAFSEIVVFSGLFLYTMIEMNQFPNSETNNKGDIMNLLYTALVDIIFAIYLLIGVYFKKPHYAKIWSIAQVVHLAVSVLIAAYRYLFPMEEEVEGGRTGVPLQLVEFAFTTCLDIYFILVVYSYYRESARKPDPRPGTVYHQGNPA